MTHDVAMRFNDAEFKLNGDTRECKDKFADTFVKMAREYQLSKE